MSFLAGASASLAWPKRHEKLFFLGRWGRERFRRFGGADGANVFMALDAFQGHFDVSHGCTIQVFLVSRFRQGIGSAAKLVALLNVFGGREDVPGCGLTQ